jgi:hypothetical protein
MRIYENNGDIKLLKKATELVKTEKEDKYRKKYESILRIE